MSEKVFGFILVAKPAFARLIQETLYFTLDRTIVARTSGGAWAMLLGGGVGFLAETAVSSRKAKKKEKEYLELSLEDILKADKHNFVIPNSEIKKVELKKHGKGAKINITANKTHKWYVRPKGKGMFDGTKPEDYDEYENMLRPIFGDKLSVKK